MKKKLCLVLAVVMAMFSFSACDYYTSVTYKLNGGVDEVEIYVDGSEGHSILLGNNNPVIKYNGQDVLTGEFMVVSDYDSEIAYVLSAAKDANISIMQNPSTLVFQNLNVNQTVVHVKLSNTLYISLEGKDYNAVMSALRHTTVTYNGYKIKPVEELMGVSNDVPTKAEEPTIISEPTTEQPSQAPSSEAPVINSDDFLAGYRWFGKERDYMEFSKDGSWAWYDYEEDLSDNYTKGSYILYRGQAAVGALTYEYTQFGLSPMDAGLTEEGLPYFFLLRCDISEKQYNGVRDEAAPGNSLMFIGFTSAVYEEKTINMTNIMDWQEYGFAREDIWNSIVWQ